MRGAGAIAITLALTACAVPKTTPRGAAEVLGSESEAPAGVVQVNVRASATSDRVTCRKTAGTGTRIAVERCESTTRSDTADKIARDQMLRDLDEIRLQAWRRDQARQDAEAALARRPAQ
jgi:hypothetical protein